jgi:hypothetical protein
VGGSEAGFRGIGTGSGALGRFPEESFTRSRYPDSAAASNRFPAAGADPGRGELADALAEPDLRYFSPSVDGPAAEGRRLEEKR